MRPFRHWSLKQKLTTIIMLTSSIVLLLVSATFVANELISFRRTVIAQLSTLSDVIGVNSTAALTFQDRKAAEEALRDLNREPNIREAVIFTNAGEIFAVYSTSQSGRESLAALSPVLAEGHWFTGNHVDLMKPIRFDGETIGWLRIRSDIEELLARLWVSIGIATGLTIVLGLLAYVLSSTFQRVISVPILNLVRTMKTVSSEKDYSVRVESGNQDELGSLIEGFNDMLSGIQERDTKLKQYGEDLEHQVLERTEELSRLNLGLQQSERCLKKQQVALLRLTKSQAIQEGDMEAALTDITETAAHTLDVDRVCVWLFTDDAKAIECVDLYERRMNRHTKGDRLAVADFPTYFQGLAQEQMIASNDARNDPRTRALLDSYLTPLGITSMLDVSIPFGVRTAGVICHEHVGSVRQWTLEEQQFCNSMAGLISLALESAERSRTEQSLRQSEEQTRLIIETALDAVIVMDEHGTITQWNPQAELIFGWPAREAIGKSLADTIIPTSYRERHRQGLRRFLTTGEASVLNKRIEITAARRNGEEFPVELAISHFKRGARSLFTGFLVDISERKRAEQALLKAKEDAEAASRAKSQFLANMSHEIRTPMNGVLGMTELLLATELATKQRRYAETAQKSGRGLLAVINDILDFSRIEAGKLSLEYIDFDLRDTVEECVELLAERAHTKGLELACHLPADLPTTVRGDPHRLRQILMNLIGNALKFTEQGEVIVSVGLVEHTDEIVSLRFEVKDTGIGISPDASAHIFQSFSQADGSTTRKYGGTGLGLAIVKQLVEMMQGTVGLDSTIGKGSSFWFVVRLLKPLNTTAVSSKNNAILQNLRVLIVDDNETNRYILQDQLSSWGIIHASADSGPRALQLLGEAVKRGQPYDVAILDMQMPGMDGLMVARTIQAIPVLKAIRLVLLTSIGPYADAEAIRQAGILVSLTKPVCQSHLFDCLANVMAAPFAVPIPPESHEPPQRMPVNGSVYLLLAEDNSVNQEVALGMLEDLGYQVDVVGNGRDAVEASARTSYDLIFMDCQMPVMDGFAATRSIRTRETQTSRRIPIIALTAHALAGDRELCLAGGMDDYLTKPFTQSQLSAMLARWISVAAARPEGEDNGTGIPATTDDSPLNLDALKQVYTLGPKGPDIIRRAITIYLDYTPELLEAMQQAAANGDAAALNQAAHRLKSSSAMVGVRKLAECCRQLEAMASAHDLQNAAAVLKRALVDYDLAREALSSYLANTVQ